MKITDDEGRNWAAKAHSEGMSAGQVAAALGCTKKELQDTLDQFSDLSGGALFIKNLRYIFVDVPRSVIFVLAYVLRIPFIVLSLMFLVWLLLSSASALRPFDSYMHRTALNCEGTYKSGRYKQTIAVNAVIEEMAWHSLNPELFFRDINWMKVWIETEDPIDIHFSRVGEEDRYWKRSISKKHGPGDGTGSFSRLKNELILDIKNHETSDKGKVSFTFKGKCVTREM
jgi:hypothetical protein